jgi:Ni/Fe-hydrogenase subunit HybB-like protein
MSGARITEIVAPGETPASVTDRISAIALGERTLLWWWVAFIPSFGLLMLGVISVLWLFYEGVGIWGVDWPVAWGYAIINYVWWIAIASGGTFISAMFFLLRVEWRTSINRIAETMMVFAAGAAGIFPILHLGRPWFFYWLFPYPNSMSLYPQFRSPLLWDFMAILTYVVGSVVFWYFGMIPDLASVRDRARTRGKQILYGFLALGFRGSSKEWQHYRATYGIMAAIMAPVVVSIHSVVGLDFAGAQTPGWHSTQFPPFFVFGAMLSGLAAALMLIIFVRHFMHLEPYITARHFDVLGKLLLTSSLFMAYAYIMDAFDTFYGPDKADKVMFVTRMTGQYAYVYWGKIVCNVLFPQLLWSRRLRQALPIVMLICLAIIVGMWWERFEIVVTSLHRTHLPSSWGDYHGTFWDWALLLGSGGLFFTGFLLAIRIVPVVSMYEMRAMLRSRR